MDDRDRMYFGSSRNESDSVGYLDEKTRAIFGRSYAAEPDKLIEQLKKDEAIVKRIRCYLPCRISWAWNTTHM